MGDQQDNRYQMDTSNKVQDVNQLIADLNRLMNTYKQQAEEYQVKYQEQLQINTDFKDEVSRIRDKSKKLRELEVARTAEFTQVVNLTNERLQYLMDEAKHQIEISKNIVEEAKTEAKRIIEEAKAKAHKS